MSNQSNTKSDLANLAARTLREATATRKGEEAVSAAVLGPLSDAVLFATSIACTPHVVAVRCSKLYRMAHRGLCGFATEAFTRACLPEQLANTVRFLTYKQLEVVETVTRDSAHSAWGATYWGIRCGLGALTGMIQSGKVSAMLKSGKRVKVSGISERLASGDYKVAKLSDFTEGEE